MLAAGKADSREEADAYLRAVLGDYYDAEKIGAYLDSAPAMVRYLERNSNVTFEIAPTPDYSAGEEGWKTGRTLVTLQFDARQLGARKSTRLHSHHSCASGIAASALK